MDLAPGAHSGAVFLSACLSHMGTFALGAALRMNVKV